jgi:hypothetical protein
MENKKTLKIGRSEFELIVKNNHYFVDKTKLIYEFYNNENDIILIPRPKRFGKTLNLSMIEHFFDIQKPGSATLFDGFKISKYQDFCNEHQNKYPVINITLKDIKSVDWQNCFEKIKMVIVELYSKHNYLLKSDKIDELDKEKYNQILLEEASQAKFEFSLFNLSDYLQKHYGKKTIILVDEYDAPIIAAFNNTNAPIKSEDKENKTYYEKVIDFMQTFFGKAYKGNDALHKGMLTGVMRVGRESIFSEWNNFDVFGITMPYFTDSFGFTEAETEKILMDFGLHNKLDEVKYWYNGYKFGKTKNIYNPWSIVNFIAKNEAGFKPYWVNTGDYSLIKSRIIELGIKETIQDLIEGKTIEKELHDNFVFQDFETENELLWTLLTENGYLTQVEKSDFGNHKLKIPNKEVKIVFTNIIKKWIDTEVKLKRDVLIRMAKNLINNRLPVFEADLRQIIGDTLSYFDTTEKTEKDTHNKVVTHEQIYPVKYSKLFNRVNHVYTLGLFAILSDDYMIKTNRESGEGRYDIAMIPHNKTKNGIVIEIKSIQSQSQRQNEKDKDFRKRINKEIDSASEQIERKEYYKELIEYKIDFDKILLVPIVFAGKVPFVVKLSE